MGVIIAASDLTERSRAVPGRALALAPRLGARVILIHCVAPGSPPREIERVREGLLKALEGRAAEVRVLAGSPERVIAALCAEEEAELVVLGLHRPRPLRDILGLTTMEKVVLRAPVPVLIAHTSPKRPYRTVLCSTDFAPACANALAAASRIATPDAEFHAIHALQLPLREIFSPLDISHSRAMTAAQGLRTAFLGLPGVPARMHLPEIVPGGVHEILSFRLEELQPDLLAIGTHSGRDPQTLGNYARDLMRAPPTDVLVAKPPA